MLAENQPNKLSIPEGKSKTRRSFLKLIGQCTMALGSPALFTARAGIASNVANCRLRRSPPETEGVSSAAILKFLDVVEQRKLSLHSFMLLRNGSVVAEGWWKPYAPNLKHTLYSLSKSFAATAVGIAVDEGKLKLNDRVVTWLGDKLPETVEPNLAAMEIRHLLTMTGGYSKNPLDTLPGWRHNELPTDYDRVKVVLSQSVERTPGTFFSYSNAGTILLPEIFKRATSQSLFEFLRSKLFRPLEIENGDWETYAQGNNPAGFGLRLTTEDVAKFGQLYLNRGMWNSFRVLSENWVEQATCKQVSSTPSPVKGVDWEQGYGYMFWRCRHNAYQGFGAFGQFCLVLPDHNAVVVITAEDAHEPIINAIWEAILPAFRCTPGTDAQAKLQLEERLESLSLPFPVGSMSSTVASSVSGNVYTFAENSHGIRAISLTFDDDRCILKTLINLDGTEVWNETICGTAKWIDGPTNLSARSLHIVLASDPPIMRVAAGGAWRSDNTFIIHRYFTETAHHEILTCEFENDSLRFNVEKSLDRFAGPSLRRPSPIIGKRKPA